MRKFTVSVEVAGYSRGCVEVVRDDREVDWDWMKVKPYEEPPPGPERIELPPAPPGTRAVVVFVDEAVAERLRESGDVGVSIGSFALDGKVAVLPEGPCTSG